MTIDEISEIYEAATRTDKPLPNTRFKELSPNMFAWIEMTMEDWFKLMEPHFDIRYVSEIGIISGKYYHTILNRKNAGNDNTNE